MFYGSPPIVTSGSIFHVDFLNAQSYFSGSSLVRDMSGNNYSGSFATMISASYVPVPVNGTLFFTGSGISNAAGGYINFSALTTFNPALNGLSIFAFIQRVVGSTSQMVVCKDEGASTGLRDFQLQINAANQVQLTIWNNAGSLLTVGGGTTVPVGSWNYVGGTWDGATITTYLNGLRQNSGALGSPPLHSATSIPVQIGALNGGGTALSSPFNGYIALAQIYNRALSQAEILQNYNALKARFGLI